MAVVYSIRDWDEHFEKAQGRKVDSARWVPFPVKHDGKSFRRIMLRADGHEVYGAWCLIVQIAAKCQPRGVLADSDGPLTVDDLALKTGGNANVFRNALNVLCSREIAWIECKSLPDGYQEDTTQLPLQDRTGQDNLCGDDATGTADATGSEDGSEDGSEATSKANGESYPESFEAFWEAYPTRGGRKRGKGKCYGIWRQAIRAAERQPLVEAARNYAASDDSTRGYAKDPERFLAKDWWRDWISEGPTAPATVHPAAAIPARIKPARFA